MAGELFEHGPLDEPGIGKLAGGKLPASDQPPNRLRMNIQPAGGLFNRYIILETIAHAIYPEGRICCRMQHQQKYKGFVGAVK